MIDSSIIYGSVSRLLFKGLSRCARGRETLRRHIHTYAHIHNPLIRKRRYYLDSRSTSAYGSLIFPHIKILSRSMGVLAIRYRSSLSAAPLCTRAFYFAYQLWRAGMKSLTDSYAGEWAFSHKCQKVSRIYSRALSPRKTPALNSPAKGKVRNARKHNPSELILNSRYRSMRDRSYSSFFPFFFNSFLYRDELLFAGIRV